jgi:hypothetical protein
MKLAELLLDTKSVSASALEAVTLPITDAYSADTNNKGRSSENNERVAA